MSATHTTLHHTGRDVKGPERADAEAGAKLGLRVCACRFFPVWLIAATERQTAESRGLVCRSSGPRNPLRFFC